jgi:bacillithiol synthase
VSQEVARQAHSGDTTLTLESLPFSDIPGQSRLFLDYLERPLELREFYPGAVGAFEDLAARADEVLTNHAADRDAVADVLAAINTKLGAPAAVFDNIELLRKPDSVAVVTGQQAGLFTGPLYAIYKALSAVAAAERLRSLGVIAVPVFWVADEDHDFEEVSHTFVAGRDGNLDRIDVDPRRETEGLPVGSITLDDSVVGAIDRLFNALPQTVYTDELRSDIEKAWQPGTGFGDAFATQLLRLLGRFGLVVLSPMDLQLKSLSAPIYVEAVRRSAEVESALIGRSALLTERGYTPQVLIDEGYFPLFYHTEEGSRVALKRGGDLIRTKDGSHKFTIDQLTEIAEREPGRFSPNVMLRAVVQDYLLPTICYFGGGAEVAYFAQMSETYRVLGRTPSTILHRQSFTVVEDRHHRAMVKIGLGLDDLFAGRDAVLPKVVDDGSGRDIARLMADVEERINMELARLDHSFSEFDVTLAANLATRRRKIIYHIGVLRDKFRRSVAAKDETLRRRLDGLFGVVAPEGGLQERSLNVNYFLNRYGPNFIDWLYESIDIDDRGHRIINL